MRRLLSAFALALACPGGLAQTTWYVDAPGCDGSGTGSSSDPFCTIQEGIDAASDGDVVVVRHGIYRENATVPAIRLMIRAADDTFTILQADSDAAPALRLVPHAELELVGLTVTGAHGGLASRQATAVVRRCRFFDSDADSGAGISADGSELSLGQCHFENNQAMRGGAIAAVDCSIRIDACTFAGNGSIEGGALWLQTSQVVVQRTEIRGSDVRRHGGGIWSVGGELVLEGCTFAENAVFDYSGAVAILDGDARIESCAFFDNRTDFGWGGALFVDVGPARRVTVENTHFERNSAAEGGAVCVRSGEVSLSNCRFSSNEAGTYAYDESGFGGGLYVGALGGGDDGAATVLATRCVFDRNHSSGYEFVQGGRGGGVYGPVELVNCTFHRNRVDGNVEGATGGAISGAATLLNCIAWEDSPDEIEGALSVDWSDVSGDWPGEENFDHDPRFWGPEHGDYHLVDHSKCINKGDPEMTDPDGSRVDVGAFPFDKDACFEPGTYCEAKQDSGGCIPSIGWAGTPIHGEDDFHVLAHNVPAGRLGLLVSSETGAASTPFLGGTLCVESPFHRSKVLLSVGAGYGCDGSFDYHFDHHVIDKHHLDTGDRVYLQFWYRDPENPDGSGAGLTAGLEATLCDPHSQHDDDDNNDDND